MKAEIKKELSYKLTMFLLSAGVLASGVFSILFGDILIPLTAAMLASVFTLERKGRRVLSYIIPIFLVLMNVFSLLFFDGFTSFFGIFAVAFGVIISLFYSRGMSKSSCVFALTCTCALFTVLSFIYFAMAVTNNYTFSAVAEFVSLLRGALDQILKESMEAMLAYMPDSGEQIAEIFSQMGMVFDSFKLVALSFVVILGFVISGVALKFYSFFLFKLSDRGASVFDWKFRLSRIFAYFYIIISLISVFMLSLNNLMAVTVLNLYNIFMVVYAYFGFNYATYLLSLRRSRGFAYTVLIIAILVFSSLAVEILSLMGAFYAITDRKYSDENS